MLTGKLSALLLALQLLAAPAAAAAAANGGGGGVAAAVAGNAVAVDVDVALPQTRNEFGCDGDDGDANQDYEGEAAVPADFPPAITQLPPHEIYPGVFSARSWEELRLAYPTATPHTPNGDECATAKASFALPGGGLFVHDNVLTPGECRAVVNASKAWTFDYERPGEFRMALVNHVKLPMERGSKPYVDRVAALMGVDSSRVPPVIPIKSIETHQAGLRLHADDSFRTEATTVVYFQDLHHSGGLAFPAKGVVVLPRAGRAVTFTSRRASGEPNHEAIHHTMPVDPAKESETDEPRLSAALAVKLLEGATQEWFDAPHLVPAEKARPARVCHGGCDRTAAPTAAGACLTRVGMTQAQCSQLLREFTEPNGKCARPSGRAMPSLPVVWVGAGCPSQCARQAKEMGKKPKSVCGSKPLTLNDGGCKLAPDCLSIGCAATCKRQPNCRWVGNSEFMGVCQLKAQ